MAKTSNPIVKNPFEQIGEFARETTKKIPQEVGRTLNPLTFLENVNRNPEKEAQQNKEKELTKEKEPGTNSTPLSTEKLNEKYAEQDKQSLEAARKRLFDLVKSDEKKAIAENKQKEEERKKKELEEEELKKKQTEQVKKQQEMSTLPHGKIRRIIGGKPPKTGLEQQPDYRPSKTKG